MGPKKRAGMETMENTERQFRMGSPLEARRPVSFARRLTADRVEEVVLVDATSLAPQTLLLRLTGRMGGELLKRKAYSYIRP